MIPLSDTIQKSLSAYNIELDRTIHETIKLPYDDSDLHITPNTQITTNNINNLVKKIDTNFLYIVSRSYFAHTDIPINKNRLPFVLTLSATGDYIQHSTRAVKYKIPQKFTIITPNESTDTIGIITATYNKLLLGTLSSERVTGTTRRELYSSDKTTNDTSSDDTFNNIKSASCNGDLLYVLDDGAGSSKPPALYKYNIASITSNDEYIIKSPVPGRRYITQIGGKGENVEDKTTFKNPKFVYSINDSVFVVDFEDAKPLGGYIKEYDLNLNILNLHDLTVHFSKYDPVDMFKKNDNIYILCNDSNNRGYIIIYDLIGKKVSSVIALDESIQDTYTSISLSTSDSNIVYISTEKLIIKKFISKLEDTIGIFNHATTNLHQSAKYTNISNINSNTDYMDEMILGTSDGFYIFDKEYANYQLAVYDTANNHIISYDSLKVSSDEFVNYFTFNKIFHKLIWNHKLWRDNIRMSFSSKTNNLTIDYTDILSHEIQDLIEYQEDINNYIGINEQITTLTINRCIDRIYKLQQLLLKWLEVTKNTVDTRATVIT